MLFEPSSQHIHVVIAVELHLFTLGFRPLGIVDSELGVGITRLFEKHIVHKKYPFGSQAAFRNSSR